MVGTALGSAQGQIVPLPQAPAVESLREYLTQLASEWPTPGGGSAAAIVAGCGAALVSMVARICSTNAKYVPYHRLALEMVSQADALRLWLLDAKERDEAAFDRVIAAQALPKTTDAERERRRAALETALLHAAAEPLACASTALDVLGLVAQTLTIPNRSLASDLGCAGEYAYAALAASAYNVRVNHRYMHDAEAIDAQNNVLVRYEREGIALLSRIRRRTGEMLERVK